MPQLTRRRFLSDTAIASAVLAATSNAVSTVTNASAADSATPANDKLNLMLCGIGGRGRFLSKLIANNRECHIKYFCDVDEAIGHERLDEFEKLFHYRPQLIRDMRHGLDDKEIDAAVISTPNHWHALAGIWTMQAGKDVYVEKPVSHNISEGQRLIEAVQKYQQICQTGTHSRSLPGTIEAVDYVQSGKIGEVKLARALCYKRRGSIGSKGVYEPPKSVDYDLWVGPAEMQPLTRPRIHYDWHFQYHFGNGDINNQGVHEMDIARWALGIDSLCDSAISYGGRLGYEDAGDTANTQVSICKSGDKTIVHEMRGLPSDPLMKAAIGNIFYGTEGVVVLTGWGTGFALDLDGKVVRKFNIGSKGALLGSEHIQNFVDAVKSRNPDDLNGNIRDGHLSAGLCHIASISYRLGKQTPVDQVQKAVQEFGGTDDNVETLQRTVAHLKGNGIDLAATPMTLGPVLKIDTKAETFIDNEAANAMLTRKYRKNFEVPKSGEV